MAEYEDVKQGINEIAAQISAVQTRYNSAKSNIEGGSAALAAITTKYADVLATIDGYAPTGAAETLAKDEKAKLQVRFLALKAKLDALIATAEFSA